MRTGEISDEMTIYQIEVAGHLHDNWAQWLNGMILKIQEDSNDTAILISVPDQAALRGTLNKLWDLNLVLLSIQHVDPKPNVKFE